MKQTLGYNCRTPVTRHIRSFWIRCEGKFLCFSGLTGICGRWVCRSIRIIFCRVRAYKEFKWLKLSQFATFLNLWIVWSCWLFIGNWRGVGRSILASDAYWYYFIYTRHYTSAASSNASEPASPSSECILSDMESFRNL